VPGAPPAATGPAIAPRAATPARTRRHRARTMPASLRLLLIGLLVAAGAYG
jgi:hypothetical protein